MFKSFEWADTWRDYAPLVLRVATGLVFAMHGYQKLSQFGLEGTAGFLATIGFPLASFFAVLLIAAELLGGIALVVGLFTRLTAKVLSIVAIVAWVTVHLTSGFFVANGGFEFIMLILAASISLVITGPGAYALDSVLRKRSQE